MIYKKFLESKRMSSTFNENNIEPEHPLVFDAEIFTSINDSVDQPEQRNLKDLTDIRLKYQNQPITGQQFYLK